MPITVYVTTVVAWTALVVLGVRAVLARRRHTALVARLEPLARTPVGSQRPVHRGGVPWDEAPLPPRWHRCYPHSGVWHHTEMETWLERCPCGGRRIEGRPWTARNSCRDRGFAALEVAIGG